jgi:hypothetical protein
MILLSELHVHGKSLVIEEPLATKSPEITARLRSNKKFYIGYRRTQRNTDFIDVKSKTKDRMGLG